MDIKSNSIKFLPTKDLMDELFSRFDSGMFVGCQMKSKNDAGLGWHTQGDYFTLVGLNRWISNRIEDMEPLEDKG